MNGKIDFIRDTSTGIEVVSCEHVATSYPEHTHTEHYVLGIVTDGEILIVIDGQEYQCSAGNLFSVPPNICHAIRPISEAYSMISTCIQAFGDTQSDLNIIKEKILGNPEFEFDVNSMAKEVYISPYHMIRKFKEENGLTPHKFQVQCRIRKAQKLLEEGQTAANVAQMVGFFDQSHLDRVFRKQVGMSPTEYRKLFMH